MTAGFIKDQITVEIVEHLVTLSTKPNGWSKECNIVVWNHNEPKVVIREWSEDHKRMGKGVVLTEDEAVKLLNGLMNWKGVM